MDVILISPMEIGLNDKTLFREVNIKSDIENVKTNLVSNMYTRRSRENLGVELLASYLRENDCEVMVINAHSTTERADEVVEHIIDENPAVVGISLLYDLHAYNACVIAQKLKKAGYKGHITFGGPFITFTSEYFLRAISELDSVIRGEGEITLLKLINAVKANEDWQNINGISCMVNGEFVQNPAGEIMLDLTDMPSPSRDYLQALKRSNVNMRVAMMLASKGCNGRCTYCTSPASTILANTPKWRHRSAKRVVCEIEDLVNEYNIEFLYFCDYNFFGYGCETKGWLNEFAELMCERNIKVRFHATVRADTVLDTQLMQKLKAAGLQFVLLGVESGSQATLDRWRKGTTVKQNEEAIKIIRDLGFELDPGMIMVDAHTTVEEFSQTVAFIERTGINECFFPMYLFNQVAVYPGTQLEKELLAENLIVCPDPCLISEDVYSAEGLQNFCRKVATRPYTIKDECIRDVWEVLTSYSNDVSMLLENTVQEFLGIWRSSFKDMSSKDSLRKVKREYLKFVSSLGGWRKDVGTLAINLMKTSAKFAVNKKNGTNLTKEELENQLGQVIADYDMLFFPKGLKNTMKDYIEEYNLDYKV